MRLFSEAVLQFLDEYYVPEANIFGYSMGGYVALGLAAEHPTRINQVVTLGTKMDWSPEVAADMGQRFDPEKIQSKVPVFADLLAQVHAPADWKLVCQYTNAFLRDLGSGLGLTTEMFDKITCPVTIGWGELDNVVTAEESRRVAERILHGKFQRLEGVKHPIEQVNAAKLANFLVAELEIKD